MPKQEEYTPPQEAEEPQKSIEDMTWDEIAKSSDEKLVDQALVEKKYSGRDLVTVVESTPIESIALKALDKLEKEYKPNESAYFHMMYKTEHNSVAEKIIREQWDKIEKTISFTFIKNSIQFTSNEVAKKRMRELVEEKEPGSGQF